MQPSAQTPVDPLLTTPLRHVVVFALPWVIHNNL
jgi:hypothetical protein